MNINVSAPSTGRVLLLAEAKDQMRVDFEDDDALITSYLDGETEYAEDITNRAFLTQTIDRYLNAWPGTRIKIPRPPLQSVTSITYRPQGSTAYSGTVPSTDYVVSTFGFSPFVELKSTASWPTDTLARTNPIQVRFIAGYGTVGSDVPQGIRTAILLRTADRYEHREETVLDVRPIKTGAADALLATYRVSVAS